MSLRVTLKSLQKEEEKHLNKSFLNLINEIIEDINSIYP